MHVFDVGGVLQIAGLGNYAVLLILLFDCVCNRKMNKGFLASFLVAFAGALINVAAPGNYVRHSAIDSEPLSLVDGLINSVSVTFWELYEIYLGTLFVIVFICAYIVGSICKKAISARVVLAVVSALGLGIVVTAFPVALGYSTKDPNFPNRARFALDMVTVLSGLATAMLLGAWLQKFRIFKWNKLKMIAVVVIIFVVLTIKGIFIERFNTVFTARSLIRGEIKSYTAAIANIYDEIEKSDVRDYCIKEMPDPIPVYMEVVFSEDPDDWINVSLARLYHKDHVWYGGKDG